MDEVEFYMLKDKPEEVKERLAHMYNKKPKFICINDDMDHTKDPSNETLNELHDFFYKYYPYPSPFEITDPNEYHPYYRKDEMIKNGYWKSNWNHDKGIFNDRFQTKIAMKKNMFKSNKLQYTDHRYYKGKTIKKTGNETSMEFITNNDNNDINNDNNGNNNNENNKFSEKIRLFVYTQFIVRISGLNKYLQMIVIFIVSTIIVLTVMYIWDLIYYYTYTTFIWISTWTTTNNNSSSNSIGNGMNGILHENDNNWKSILKECCSFCSLSKWKNKKHGE